ncbi:TIGR02677 family protein [Clostridium gasigenes]|uniref:TIGR02677 family protein n=1 Tax=Clostridium gasigenes TaxID=94869 RepID=UPI00143859E2|nr:TIGR02677 family protein [Clostridium gasigenes]NKF06095.1 TIGR02677 family protein [Clostridium gasigenes]QSW19184.1 TIGR02677 family protein [Clostridium gasigenes]
MISTNVRKRLTEVNYLNTDNTWRYRNIIRIAYINYEKMKYWLYAEEIYDEIINVQGFNSYTLDNLKGDLEALKSWGNFAAIQDTKRTTTIEEFKNRKFRYQISYATIELERTLIKIEAASDGMRGSLEISLIERFRDTLKKLEKIEINNNGKDLFSLWEMLNRDFKHLNENYQDYISKFFNPKTEELLKTTEFLIYKESFIKYLREFIKGIQINVPQIQKSIEILEEDTERLDLCIKKIVKYEKNTIALNADYNENARYEINAGRYMSMKEWFVAIKGRTPMGEQILESTNGIIRKITRYALQITEINYGGGNRLVDYRKLAQIFNNTKNIEEAHKLSSLVFGVFNTRHIVCNTERETESINSSIFEENPTVVTITPSRRDYGRKTASTAIVKNKSEEKNKKGIEVLEKRKKEEELIESYIKDNKLIFRNLAGISKEERIIFLTWLSKSINDKSNSWIRNEYGKSYKIVNLKPKDNIKINCEDGDFTMPDYEIVFK